MGSKLIHESLTREIVGAFYSTYNALGFGYPESICSKGLAVELQKRGLNVEREVPIEVVFLGVVLGTLRLDMVVDDRVVVEVKATATIGDADVRQILTYLKGSKYEVGLLLHFGPSAQHQRFVYESSRKASIPSATSA